MAMIVVACEIRFCPGFCDRGVNSNLISRSRAQARSEISLNVRQDVPVSWSLSSERGIWSLVATAWRVRPFSLSWISAFTNSARTEPINRLAFLALSPMSNRKNFIRIRSFHAKSLVDPQLTPNSPYLKSIAAIQIKILHFIGPVTKNCDEAIFCHEPTKYS